MGTCLVPIVSFCVHVFTRLVFASGTHGHLPGSYREFFAYMRLRACCWYQALTAFHPGLLNGGSIQACSRLSIQACFTAFHPGLLTCFHPGLLRGVPSQWSGLRGRIVFPDGSARLHSRGEFCICSQSSSSSEAGHLSLLHGQELHVLMFVFACVCAFCLRIRHSWAPVWFLS